MPLSTPQISELNDEALFALIEKGDERAFTQAYDRYHKLLYVLAYRYLMNANMAEDVVQHVFSRLWEFRTELRVGISLKNYLFTMTKNHVLNLIRNENSAITKNYEMAQSAPVYEDNLIENLEKKELMSNFYKAVDMLPVQKREICLMKVREELTNQEIAERMKLSVNTVKTHYSEALKLLRVHLRKMLIIVTALTLLRHLSVYLITWIQRI
ncbi:RNA polymerase sigma-70 factor [Bacteroides sp. AM16-24]|uniref:RNA polymerase sigma factor n=1 Tax=Bacteroides sp. AM16-24 TaxID=2292002 RepID=UPI000E4B71D1|nr:MULTISPECIES: RNA polymerase sigma-70 factor [Bacteroides]RHI12714.1 RNA polymerase sigma-70 factor [Bacteroides sp. AM16-24]